MTTSNLVVDFLTEAINESYATNKTKIVGYLNFDIP